MESGELTESLARICWRLFVNYTPFLVKIALPALLIFILGDHLWVWCRTTPWTEYVDAVCEAYNAPVRVLRDIREWIHRLRRELEDQPFRLTVELARSRLWQGLLALCPYLLWAVVSCGLVIWLLPSHLRPRMPGLPAVRYSPINWQFGRGRPTSIKAFEDFDAREEAGISVVSHKTTPFEELWESAWAVTPTSTSISTHTYTSSTDTIPWHKLSIPTPEPRPEDIPTYKMSYDDLPDEQVWEPIFKKNQSVVYVSPEEDIRRKIGLGTQKFVDSGSGLKYCLACKQYHCCKLPSHY